MAVLEVFFVLLALVGLVFYKKIIIPKPVEVDFDSDKYWGPGEQPFKLDESIRKFEIDVPDTVIQDLKQRLSNMRPLTPPLEGIQQQYGINSNLLKEILEFWRTKYNWTERQEYLNKYPQYKTNIQGLDIHFLHVKPQNVPKTKKILPLMILHGWPGSVREFYEIIPHLTTQSDDRDFVFEVIAPHIPGYGFSQAAAKPGLGANQIAVIMNNLMQRLGFKQYYCQGGDFGAIILQSLTILYPNNVLGYHTNMAYVSTPLANIKTALGMLYPGWIVRKDHQDRVYPLWDKFMHRIRETGYLHLQATKPDTLGVGVGDSPAGLAAYILEKFTTGTNIQWQTREDGGLLEKFTYTNLLDNVMIYWISNSATTSFRLYAESFSTAHTGQNVLRQPIKVPTAVARFRWDFYVADGLLGEIYPNNLQLSDFDGGHFAAFEVPEVLAQDIFNAVEKFLVYQSNVQQ
ncbi:unnamed protein product [Ceutorhynchus assimilis]|uniref:Epoxide hydrolase n=1 Tax=Ceutorhynchus assimilis TaxID=467358 RepID=A0A9P0GMY3_9CUCU|nr:unnamed protein product [Ceutorhynchus assimilis]